MGKVVDILRGNECWLAALGGAVWHRHCAACLERAHPVCGRMVGQCRLGCLAEPFLMTVDCMGPGSKDLGTWARGSQVQAAWAQPASPLKWNLAQCPVWFEIRATGPGLPRALAAREG